MIGGARGAPGTTNASRSGRFDAKNAVDVANAAVFTVSVVDGAAAGVALTRVAVSAASSGVARVAIPRIIALFVEREEATMPAAFLRDEMEIRSGIEATEEIAQVAKGVETEVRSVSPRSLRPTEQLSSKSQAQKMSKLMGGDKGYGPFEPVDAVEHDGSLYISDGHHRTAAAIRARVATIPVRVRPTTSPEEGQQLIRDWTSTLSDR
jgi:hypothetical protein